MRGAAGTRAEPATVLLLAAPGDMLQEPFPVLPQGHLAPVEVLGSLWQSRCKGWMQAEGSA